ncbi:MAG: hypothetical protein JWO56_206, partial [Acidobacteria bacterium]|nr:hypothetical protein [Acidobacteriota bacterium]
CGLRVAGCGLRRHDVVMTMPEFPIRLLFDDGEVVELESPEELMERIQAIDSDDPRVWVRDALDRNVGLRMRYGSVERFEVV